MLRLDITLENVTPAEPYVLLKVKGQAEFPREIAALLTGTSFLFDAILEAAQTTQSVDPSPDAESKS